MYDEKFWKAIEEEYGNEFGNSTDLNDKRPFIHLYLEDDLIDDQKGETYDAWEEDPLKFKPYPGALSIQLWDKEKKDWDGYNQFITYENIRKVNIFK